MFNSIDKHELCPARAEEHYLAEFYSETTTMSNSSVRACSVRLTDLDDIGQSGDKFGKPSFSLSHSVLD